MENRQTMTPELKDQFMSKLNIIKTNLLYMHDKMENGEVSHYHVYKMYVEDVNTVLELCELSMVTLLNLNNVKQQRQA